MTVESRSLQNIISKLGHSYGNQFFEKITLALADSLQCDFVFIATLERDTRTAKTISVCAHDTIVDNFEYALKDTPCEIVANQNVCCYTSGITSLYPNDQLLKDMNIESYVGVPLYNTNKEVLGLVVALHTKPIVNDDDIVTLFELFSSRISLELSRIELQDFDSLTHLHSKTYLQNILADKKEYSLVIADINYFSYINEAYGFAIGDSVLKKVAHILKTNFSEHVSVQLDIDKFVLLYSANHDIKRIIKEIQDYFTRNIIEIDTFTLYISFSYGVAIGHENLLRTASIALKESKKKGRNAFKILEVQEEQDNFPLREVFLETNNILHEAFEKDNVIPFFQGIRDNKTGKIAKFESLARINHNGKVLLPYQFLEPAKLSGMLPSLTKVMIQKSFEVMKDTGYDFSINITEDDLNYHYLDTYLLEQSKHYSIEPERVILEILEGISSHSKNEHTRQLKDLKAMGFKLAIDDFGAEYSNFERILDLDVDFLKIDAQYIKNIDTDIKSLEIVKAIVLFTKSLGITTIAEFVHSVEVQKIVQDLGIDYSQGYLFSQPSPQLTG